MKRWKKSIATIEKDNIGRSVLGLALLLPTR